MLVTVAIAAPLATAFAGPSSARAQEPPPEFTFGSGQAQAGVFTPALLSGELTVGLVLGDSVAAYQDETARARSTAVDVPVLNAANGLSICGRPSPDLLAGLPQPISVDTGESGNTEPAARTEPAEGQGPYVQSVDAEPGAASHATTDMLDVELPGLVTVNGGRASTAVTADPASMTRSAGATTTIGSVEVLGGLIRLEGMRWELSQTQVGPDERSDERSVDAGFTMDGITIAPPGAGDVPGLPQAPDAPALPGLPTIPGLPGAPGGGEPGELHIPAPDSGQVEPMIERANQALAPLGLQIRMPRLESFEGVDRHRLTPLEIALVGEEFVLAQPLGQLLNTEQVGQVQNALVDGLFDPQECAQLGGAFQAVPELNAYWNTVGNAAPVLLAALTGVASGGEANLSIGGLETSLDDTYYPELSFSPPELRTPPGSPGSLGSPAGGPSSGLGPGGAGAGAGGGGAGATGTTAPPSAGGDEAAMDTVTSTECRSSSPAGRPGCWFGEAAWGGVAVSAVAGGSLVADEVMRRRRSRPSTAPGAGAGADTAEASA